MLNWPEEIPAVNDAVPRWHHPGSNICLDLHGDPPGAGLVVFSDGNHHMAIKETLALFQETHPAVQGVFM